MKQPKKTLDEWLAGVDYSELNSSSYEPSLFALTFMNFIKLVNGEEGETNTTPPIHLKMLDKLSSPSEYIVNLLFRGAAKTTLFMEYLSLYIAVFGGLPGQDKIYGMIYVSDSIDNGVKNARKNIEFRYENSEFLKEWIPNAKFTDKYIEFTNKEGKKLGIKLFGAATGIRGSKVFGKRPTLAILDDLIGDNDATSKATMDSIKETVYRGVNYALDTTNRKVVFNGTPFSKDDVIVEAVESGGWEVNVFPVCEKYPCTKEEFVGAWEDRFPYEFVESQYEFARLNDEINSFYQELMLRITNEEERLVKESEIKWYDRDLLVKNAPNFNFYITTDFATSAKQSADFSVISVWAYNSNGDWFWVDGFCERTTMDVTINNLFRLAQKYRPQSVGIEVSGQQGGFVTWIQQEMITRNIWFNFASSSNSGAAGIRPSTDKLSRFNYVVPLFKMGKMFFPASMMTSPPMIVFLEQIRLAMRGGFKGKDDFIDTISMLPLMNAYRPSEEANMQVDDTDIWYSQDNGSVSAIDSYIV
jgi:predicted phage terminase large subunit-like protein